MMAVSAWGTRAIYLTHTAHGQAQATPKSHTFLPKRAHEIGVEHEVRKQRCGSAFLRPYNDERWQTCPAQVGFPVSALFTPTIFNLVLFFSMCVCVCVCVGGGTTRGAVK